MKFSAFYLGARIYLNYFYTFLSGSSSEDIWYGGLGSGKKRFAKRTAATKY